MSISVSTAPSNMSEVSHRVLMKKLEVLKVAADMNKETVKEAVLAAKKLQTDIERDLRFSPPQDIHGAQTLQKLYINCVEVTLRLLRVLDEHGIVLVGENEFLPNTKLYSIEKWIQQRFARYPRGNPFVWGIAPPMAHMTEVLKRSKLYIDAHHILIRIEYNTALSKKAKKKCIEIDRYNFEGSRRTFCHISRCCY